VVVDTELIVEVVGTLVVVVDVDMSVVFIEVIVEVNVEVVGTLVVTTKV
jgi:hypothetical protein